MHQSGTFADRQELEQLVWTLGRCLDERDFGGLRLIFTARRHRHDPGTGPADPAPFLVGEVYRFTFRRTP